MATSWQGRTIVMSGGSRGIGLEIALAAGRRGANVLLLAKTDTPDPRLCGTIHTAVDAIRTAGGAARGIVGDVRDEASVQRAVSTAVDEFGGIDIVINNASAISLEPTLDLPQKRFDLMMQIQLRGTHLLTSASLPHLRRASNPHILSLSPPINLAPHWLGSHPAYTTAKYGMSLMTLGWAAEFADEGVAANCLWPETYIATAAVQNLLGGDQQVAKARRPEIMADAAIAILSRDSRDCTGNTYLDADVVRAEGSEPTKYGPIDAELDIFVDKPGAAADTLDPVVAVRTS